MELTVNSNLCGSENTLLLMLCLRIYLPEFICHKQFCFIKFPSAHFYCRSDLMVLSSGTTCCSLCLVEENSTTRAPNAGWRTIWTIQVLSAGLLQCLLMLSTQLDFVCDMIQ